MTRAEIIEELQQLIERVGPENPNVLIVLLTLQGSMYNDQDGNLAATVQVLARQMRAESTARLAHLQNRNN